jgi:DNA repair protein RadC
MTIHLTDDDKIKVTDSLGVYKVMLQILLREEEIDRDKEHFWVVALSNNNRIMLIELISLGSVNKTIVEPMEVFSFALQKRAVKIILVHTHPSGELAPSAADNDLTDRLIQSGKLVNCPVIDHLIITTEGYTSFADTGLMAQLQLSTKYALDFEQVHVKRAVASKAEEMAKKMLKDKQPIEAIVKYSGLTKKQVEKLQEEISSKKKK